MRVAIASDHGGFVLKEQIANLLRDAAMRSSTSVRFI
jgi:ribose 5-phosphate isomerase RpiB